MAEIVNMPKLGFDMAEGTLVRWVISEGESVEKGAVLAEIETDKATVEVESTYSGVVKQHLVDEGAIVPVGDPIAVVGEEGEEVNVDELLGEKAPVAKAEAEEPAEVEEPAEPEREPAKAAAEEPEAEPAPEGAQLPGGVRASPVARRMAEEKGIDLSKVNGSGPRGRIVKADIEEIEAAPPEKAPERAPTVAAPMPAMIGEVPEDQRIELSRLRATIGRRMAESTSTIPHIFITRDFDMAGVMRLRKQVNALLPEGEKTSVNDYILKAAALALREHPNLNASLDAGNKEIVRHGHINIGVAVAVENGLLTVVCHDADRKPIRLISIEVKEMAERVRSGRVKPEDIEGSTFTVSNLGMFGVEHFTAIINPPEAAILAVGGVSEVPVVVDGELQPGMRMKVTLSVDHRVSDGADGASFLQVLAKYIEDPLRLML